MFCFAFLGLTDPLHQYYILHGRKHCKDKAKRKENACFGLVYFTQSGQNLPEIFSIRSDFISTPEFHAILQTVLWCGAISNLKLELRQLYSSTSSIVIAGIITLVYVNSLWELEAIDD